LPPCDGDLRCEKCGHDQFRKERDIVDVWFDSGISAIAVLPASSDKRHAIANLILEGKEQFCGWYQSSILNCLQFKDRIPTQRIITYGRISGEVPVSGDSSCQLLPPNSEIAASEITYATLSKYELALSPQQALQRWGAELMRIWVCSYDLYQTRPPFHLRCTEIAHHYRKVRNCLRFMLGNLYDFKVGEELVAFELLEDIDRYILDILHHKIKSILTAYKEYQFPLVWRTIYEFCLRDLSNFYFDVIKDRLYNSGADWSVRRSSQTALFMIAETLCRLLAPILCFTAEEAWQQLVAKGAKPQSVHLAHLPSLEDIPDASDLCEIWKLLRHTRRQTQLAFNQHRQDIGIMQVKATHTRLYPLTSVLRTAIEYYNPALLAQILGVSQLEVAPREQIAPDRAWRSPLSDLAIDISKASGHICPRCRIVHTESTKNRKNNLCVRCQRATQ
jgi:isoleucyl-tRNA synthetase